MLIVMGLQVLLKAPITAVWAIAKISGKSWQWTFSTGVAVAVLMVIVPDLRGHCHAEIPETAGTHR